MSITKILLQPVGEEKLKFQSGDTDPAPSTVWEGAAQVTCQAKTYFQLEPVILQHNIETLPGGDPVVGLREGGSECGGFCSQSLWPSELKCQTVRGWRPLWRSSVLLSV